MQEAHLAEPNSTWPKDLMAEAVKASTKAKCDTTYADFEPGEYGVIVDPRGWLTVVRGNPASALEGLGLATGDPVWITASQADASA